MSAPEQPRTAKATAAVVRRGQETKAAALRQAGWLVIPPEAVAALPPDVVARLASITKRGV
jgi:hypothetical protein